MKKIILFIIILNIILPSGAFVFSKKDKALEKELQGIATDELKENFLENEFKLILKSQVPNWLINFRKAMEE